ncbi:hypothetical protein D3C73_704290 [compost metagenome]
MVVHMFMFSLSHVGRCGFFDFCIVAIVSMPLGSALSCGHSSRKSYRSNKLFRQPLLGLYIRIELKNTNNDPKINLSRVGHNAVCLPYRLWGDRLFVAGYHHH